MTAKSILFIFSAVLAFISSTSFAATTPAPTSAPAKLKFLTLAAILYDHAPNTMIHKNYPEDYWVITNWNDNPLLGDAGTANGGAGWPNSDFELPLYILGNVKTTQPNNYTIINGETGLAGPLCQKSNNFQNCATINMTDRTPIYAYKGRSPLGQIQSPLSFYQFFHLVKETYAVPYNLTLTQKSADSNTYAFMEELFYPVDGIGWNDRGFSNEDNQYHNFGYCMVLHTRFAYTGGEVFYFSGDDDVYVFLDNRLMIDLGGVHTELSARIALDDVGLTKGQNYRFDFFYCERHTIVSEIQIETTIQFYCAYYDWCDVCEGNGQSCCTAGVCNDNNPCTTDQCAILIPPTQQGGCVHTATNCTLGDMCYTYYCDPVKGCQQTKLDCDDGTACTIDSCDPATGCKHTDVNCNDNSKCTTDSCDKTSGCKNVPVACDASNACLVPQCGNTTGCTYTPLPCVAPSACFTAVCDKNNGCIKTEKVCKDSNACTDDSCDPILGCQTKPTNCTGNDKCFTYGCDPASGCTKKQVDCDDHNNCTIDDCDPAVGCTHTPLACVTNGCSTSSCGVGTGCTGTVVCDDKDPCTVDSCASPNGVAVCSAVPTDCKTVDLCFPKSCDKATGGCITGAVNCDDQNNCTVDTCVDGVCFHTLKCPTGDPCKPVTCLPDGSCQTGTFDCSSGNLCIKDACVAVGGNATCTHVTTTCTSTPCAPQTCNETTGSCMLITSDVPSCDDHNPCTADKITCGPTDYYCNYTNIAVTLCDDKNACTNDICDTSRSDLTDATGSQACSHTDVKCDTDSKCKTATGNCDPTKGCQYIDKVCGNTTDFCLVSICDDAVGCLTVARTCVVPDNYCYIGTCDPLKAECVITQRPNWATIKNAAGITCLLAYNKTAKALAISAGALAGIIIGAVVVAALLAFGGKKGYDLWLANRAGPAKAVGNNPIYAVPPGSGNNPMYG